MADDNTLRSYRSNDPFRRDGGRSAAREDARQSSPNTSDPLAELARLIGQADPFADLDRKPAAGATDSPNWNDSPASPNWSDPPQAPPPYQAIRNTMRDEDAIRGEDRLEEPAPEPLFAPRWRSQRRDGYHMPPAGAEPEPQDDQAYQEEGAAYDEPAYGHRHQAYDTPQQQFDSRYETAGHADYALSPYAEQEPEEPYYADAADADPAAYDDAMYDDPPRKNWRRGLGMAVGLIACGMVGTAGAYAVRTYYSSAGSSPTSPPVIVADRSPTKIVPAGGETPSGKAIQDRVGSDSAQTERERVVPREEQPVDPKSLAPPPPRVVLPSPVAPSSQVQAIVPSAPPPSGRAASSGGEEPKRVRTVTIRPDGTDASGRPVGSLPPGQAPARTGTAAPARPANRGPAAPLDPQASAASEPAPVQPAPPPAPRLAAVPPPTTVPSSTSSSGTGNYLVQVSSQRSESEAQASFRALQAKYPDVLGNLQVLVRRADLGAKGVYYRAMVGPFASNEEAVQLCNSLKAAGGQCLIPRN